MGIMVYRDVHIASNAAAMLLSAKMIEKPDAVLGFCPASDTPYTYRQLISMTSAGMLDWSEITVFHTSELIRMSQSVLGLQGDYMRRNLYDAVKLHPERVLAPPHVPKDIEQACIKFDDDLALAGGMDVLFMHIGSNGRLALNGPNREFSAYTHMETLPEGTAAECASLYAVSNNAQMQAITMGISTLLSARHIILCAFGKEWSGLVAAMLSTKISASVPASLLQLHPNVTYVLDEGAAAAL